MKPAQKLQFVICPGQFPSSQHKHIYKNIYNCWQRVWSEALKELHGNVELKSDNFTRQDYIGAILVDGECKAMGLYRHADSAMPTFATESYFSNWSHSDQEKLRAQGDQILIASHFTIHPSARKNLLGFSMRDVLMGFCSEIAVHTQAHAMTGAMRKDRGVHNLAIAWGALLVVQDVPSGHGDYVDLVAFYKDEVQKNRNHPYLGYVKELWENRLILDSAHPDLIGAPLDSKRLKNVSQIKAEVQMENRENLINLLDQTFRASVDSILGKLDAFPWHDEKAYSAWLAQTFYMVQHTTRYLCFTASQFSIEHQEFHQFCLSHLREETGHELLAKNDLESFGSTLNEFPPASETEMMIRSQYDWIQKSPFSHFGFFWVLEKLSVEFGREIIRRAHMAHGPDCLSFIELHANEDVGHVKEIKDKVDQIPVEHLSALIENIEQTGLLYSKMLVSLANDYQSIKSKKKAA